MQQKNSPGKIPDHSGYDRVNSVKVSKTQKGAHLNIKVVLLVSSLVSHIQGYRSSLVYYLALSHVDVSFYG